LKLFARIDGFGNEKTTRYEYRISERIRVLKGLESNGLRGFSRETDRTGLKDTKTLTVGQGELGEIKDKE
jgi:hypothetical protein